MADLPTAAIVCIAVGLYVALIVSIVLLCYCLKGRGRCSGGSNCCAKKEGEQSCECCIAMAEACNCCKGPSLRSCLDSCCPNRKHITCVDIIMCQCCSSDGTTFCDKTASWCRSEPQQISLCRIQAAETPQEERVTICHCCKPCRREDPETCNCLCLEIRLRSSHDKDADSAKLPPPGSTVKQAWLSEPPPSFHGIPTLPDPAGPDGFRILNGHHDLHLDQGWFGNAAYPVSTHPIHTGRSETLGDLVPTSTPRFHQGQSQLFIRPGVYSAGRVIAKKELGQWNTVGRRWPSRRRSSRRIRSPLTQRQVQRRRSSRFSPSVRAISRRHSHRDRVSEIAHQEKSQNDYETED